MLEDEGILEPKAPKLSLPGYSPTDLGDGYLLTPSLSQGIVAVKRDGKQLIQVTSGMAGSLDKAHAVALELGKVAAKKKLHQKDQSILKEKRQECFDNKDLEVVNLGLDQRMSELQAKKEELNVNTEGKKQTQCSNVMTESDALKQLC